MELVNIGLVMLVSCFVELDMKMMLDLDPIVSIRIDRSSGRLLKQSTLLKSRLDRVKCLLSKALKLFLFYNELYLKKNVLI